MYIFFKIRAPDANSPRAWAARMCSAYGFEYHPERFGRTTVLAWPIDDVKELIENLELDGIEFISFEVDDLDKFLGLDQ